MKRLLRAFRRDNRGSGIVTVLVTMFFIVSLGATMLFLSYTGLQIKASDRKSKENFYSADTAMQQVRTGVEQAVSETLKTAYTNMLQSYSADNEEYQDKVRSNSDSWGSLNAFMTSKFQEEFQADLLGWTNSAGDPLLMQSGADSDTYTYSPDVLRGFLTVPDGVTADLTGDGSVTVTYNKNDMPVSLTLHGITLAYTGGDGYETNITTNLLVTYPPFSYTPAAYSVANVSKFAMIAKKGLACSAVQNLTLRGDAYAGTVSADNGATLYHPDGTLVSGGDVKVDNLARFSNGAAPGDTTPAGTPSLWAKNLTVGNSAEVDLPGNVYVNNDLILAGEKAKALLSGRYYGFGYSVADASNSSSILVNGRNTALNLSGLTSLMLAGNSFIDASGANEGSGEYIMGQSLAARSDQLAYLVPASCLPDGISSNPCIVTSAIDSGLIGGIMNRVSTLYGSDPEEYPYLQDVDEVQPVYVHLNSTGNGTAAYLFFTFSSQARANRYFTAYYSQHSDEINKYLTKYLYEYQAATSILSGGYTYSGSVPGGSASGNGLAGPAAANALTGPATQYAAQYTNLCETLSENVSDGSVTNPYDHVVNSSNTGIGKLSDGTTEFKDHSGNLVAVIVKNAAEPYRIDVDTPDTLKIVITSGTAANPVDVTVDKAFSGLIVSDGTVTMNSSIDADSSGAALAALQAVDGNGDTLLSFTNLGSKTGGSTAGGAGGTSWDVGSLVDYSGWQKH